MVTTDDLGIMFRQPRSLAFLALMLPNSVQAELSRRLEGVSRKLLAERAGRMSDLYRRGRGSDEAIRDDLDALAYAVVRMPATYAAAANVLAHARRHLPSFSPQRVLDLGAGPGTATLAARETWPSIGQATLIEAHARMRALAANLLADAAADAADIRAGDIAHEVVAEPAELVIAAYVMVELPAQAAARLALRALSLTRGALVLVEPGTPAAFERLRGLRDRLIAAGAHVVAPCPSNFACPMAGGDWCHFSVRLARTRDHKLVKSADVPFEDERFSYLVATPPTGVGQPAQARLLAAPAATRSGIALKLCTPAGVEARVVSRAEKAAFKAARKLDWGDAVEP